MASIKGTKTEKNVLTAFTGESAARNRYTYWAAQAKKEGFVQIEAVFEETANQEKEHAKRLFKFLEGGEVQVEIGLPAGVIGKTTENLIHAAEGEEHEWQHMYPDFAKVARAEGFEDIAKTMDAIGVAEKFHGERYRKLEENIRKGLVFQREDPKTVWRCRNCGYLHVGSAAPDVCPACAHPKAHFELIATNW
ncbi:MAG: rubrerythrin family protein [Verrucomicrobiota bacterium]|jgi:rubrerythrin|nr:rubrerythrin family protein [Verrucomicrobiota bacterium]